MTGNRFLKHTFNMAIAIVAAIFVVPNFASSALAAESHWMYGVWCSENEIMYVGDSGIGFNEHTVCGWTQSPAEASPANMVLACKNVHFFEDVAVEADHEMMALHVTKVDNTTLSVKFRDDPVPEIYDNCAE